MLSVDKVIHHTALQGTGAIESNQGGNVIEIFRPEPYNQIAHPRAFQLEHSSCIPAAQEFIRFRIVQGQVTHVQFDPIILLDESYGIVDDCQVAQSQKVELNKAGFLHVFHGKLRHHFALGTLIERHVLDDGKI